GGGSLTLVPALTKTMAADGLGACVIAISGSSPTNPAVLLALKVRDGRKLDLMLRDLVRDLPAAEKKQLGIRWNHARHGTARIHKFRVAGEKDSMLLAIRDDLVMVGEDTTEGLKALKDALDKPVKASSTPTPALHIEANSGWFLADEETAQAFRKAVPGADPASLKARLTMKGGKD